MAKRHHNLDPVTQYAQLVIDGTIPACQSIIKACERHINNLKTNNNFYFDADAAQHAIDFFSFLTYVEGEKAGEPFELEPWQMFIVGSIFGWKKENGKRRFRNALCEIPKKNGKSTLAAGIALYMFIADGEIGAQIYSCATKRDQAKLVWNAAKNMVQASPYLRKLVDVRVGNLNIHSTNSKFEPLGADADTTDGINPHCGIADETHRHKSSDMLDVVGKSMIARSQPLLFEITTAGDDVNSVCYQHHDYGLKILNNILQDDNTFVFIATLDEGDDWQDETVWFKANPNLGVSITLDALRGECDKAKQMPGAVNSFLRFHLNVWVQQKEKWLNMEKWKTCKNEIDLEQLAGKQCFLALDLSSKIDLTAAVALFPPQDGIEDWTYLPHFFLPEEDIWQRERDDKVPYTQWSEDGYLSLTPGNVIDYEFIEKYIDNFAAKYKVLEIPYDPWNATYIATKLTEKGYTLVEMRQGMKTMSGPSKEFEAHIISGKMNHGDNPIFRWMASNVSIRCDANENYMPEKPGNKARYRIDGIIAAIMALGRALAHQKEEESPYKTRGLRVI